MDRVAEAKLAATLEAANGSVNGLANGSANGSAADSVEATMKQGLYFWRAPTSLFVGLAEVVDPKAATDPMAAENEDDGKGEKARVTVDDPVVGGSVEAVFGREEYTGIELRGAKKYKWTSVQVDTTGLKKAGRGYPLFETEAVNVKTESLDSTLRRLTKNLKRR